jgi:peroxiredoxin
MSIQVGEKAPIISLYDTDKKQVSLGVSEKNTVILFFPLAFSGNCTVELCNIRDNISLYNTTDAEVLGVSIDSLFVLGKFKTDQNLNFPLLSDFNKVAAKAYGVLYETFPVFEMQGVSKRAAFVVDKAGVVRYAEVCPTPGELPDFTAIQACLATL